MTTIKIDCSTHSRMYMKVCTVNPRQTPPIDSNGNRTVRNIISGRAFI